jgi:hypothetical protein
MTLMATGTFPCNVIPILGKVHHTMAKNGFVGKLKSASINK